MAATDEEVHPTACSHCRGEIPAGATFCPHCGEQQESRPRPGPVLPGYTIVRALGSGGAADVYLARQDSLDRDVAIKVLRHDVNDPKQWRRFQREAQTIARLSTHPHVVTVYTAGRAETGQPYLVTEYLDRGSLGDVVAAKGPLSPEVAAGVGVAVADALVAALGLCILHRDVKPGNVLLGEDGRVKLGDFGIARLLEAQSGTTTDVIAFTPEHVAPELLRGEPDGPWSDAYGLGSTVAGALLGRSLFRMGPDERVDAFLSRKVTAPPPALPDWVPPVLARPIAAALDPDPQRRPSLPELRRQLSAAAEELSRVTSAPAAVIPSAAVPPTAVMTAPDRAAAPDGRRTGGPAPRPRPVRAAVGGGRRPGRRWGWVAALAGAVLAVGALVAAAAGVFSGGDLEGASSTSPTVPAVTAAPAAASTAPVTAASVTAPAPLPPTPVTSAPQADPPALLASGEAETYLRTYYDAIAAGDYERTWAQLAPEFQSGTARSFEYYVEFWDDNDIELGAVELVEADTDRAVINAELRWNGSSDPVLGQFTLRRGDDGAVLIAEQDTLSG